MKKDSNHSFVKLSSDKTYLMSDKNKPFFWLADTWWFGATNRTAWPQPFKSLVDDRKKKGFSVIQIVVGYPPEVDLSSKNAENSGGLPFKNNGKINSDYFSEVDKKIKYIVDNGLVPCIVGGWGHHIDILGVDRIKLLWQEIIKRYSQYPVVFCLAGEIDHPSFGNPKYDSYKSKLTTTAKRVIGFLPAPFKRILLQAIHFAKISYFRNIEDEKLKNRIKKWNDVALYISKIDQNKRLITAHVSQKLTAYSILGNPNWLSINSIQSGHSKNAIPFMVESILKSPKMIINLEPWYEGILSNFDDYFQRVAFWLCIMSGAKGHTYGAHGIWQMAAGDNFLKHWGKSNWKIAKDFSGAVSLGKSSRFLQNYQWWKISPNFSIINPSWNKNNPYYPVAAQIGDKYIFVYFPKVELNQKYSLSLPNKKYSYVVSWVDTKTLKTLKKEKLREKNLRIPKQNVNKDLLCILSSI